MGTKSKKKKPSIHPAKRQRKDDIQKVMSVIRAVRMAALLALRNQGWGNARLKRFNDQFNTILADVSNGHLSLSDIITVLETETGLTLDDLEWETV